MNTVLCLVAYLLHSLSQTPKKTMMVALDQWLALHMNTQKHPHAIYKISSSKFIVNPIPVWQMKSCFIFFLLANTQKTYIRKGPLWGRPKSYREYTRGAQGHKKNRKYNTSSQLAPSQSKKLSKERGPSFTTDLVHNQILQTKEFFNLCIESSSLSKAILFLSFQIAQKIRKGAVFHTFLHFLPKLRPHQPLRVSLTE